MGIDRSFLDKPVEEMTPDEFRLMILEPEKDTDHICWNCRYFKPVIKNSNFPPADIIGWCKKIHWPFFWCVPEHRIVKKCYAYEPIK
ncbi:MAG: hypothetical protein DRI93_01940 [Aquificota bacterium]|uniref:Uncharacterized protein n=1 Tax=Thermosulfidibacter takaii TaxID=412593 RepID=A0A7C0U620_9BACT|nr:MAG: hypothetical protein DRI93_01940 [Aquificota bacterium]RLD98771.1 MAG: hypothetical protein DRI91_02350 [Aquificota bacterium]RLD99140.1 MAG: hypothetical protein DRI92_02795 [Aquificota bacterium]HDD52924.1 hypothetical protein [Thermosulfidibacter takaii]